MSREVRFTEYVRRPEAGPGHAKILVLEQPDGGLALIAETGEVQCYTLDRIPFAMRQSRFASHYQRVEGE